MATADLPRISTTLTDVIAGHRPGPRARQGHRADAPIPGVGPITATALVVAIGGIGRFRSGRHLAAYLGLVPKQRSSGGQERLGTISKRGGTCLRTLLAHGA